MDRAGMMDFEEAPPTPDDSLVQEVEEGPLRPFLPSIPGLNPGG